MYTRSFNEEIMKGSDTDEVIELLVESFLKKYDENLQEKMKGSGFNLMVLIFSITILTKGV